MCSGISVADVGLKDVSWIVAAGCRQQHRAGGHKGTSLLQTLAPLLVIKTVRQVNVHPSESCRHWMHSVGRSRRRRQAKAAVEQGVIHPQREIDPLPFASLDSSERRLDEVRCRCVPLAKREFSPPHVIVGKFVRGIGCQRRQQHRKRPGEFVHIEQHIGIGLARRYDDRFPRRHGLLQRTLVTKHKQCAQGVTLVGNRKDFVLGIPRPNHVGLIDADQFVGNLDAQILISRRRRGVGNRDPIGERKNNVQVLGQNNVAQLINAAMDVCVTGVPTQRRRIDPTPKPNGRHQHIGIRYGQWLLIRKVSFPPFDRQRVISRWNHCRTGMGRNRRVILDRVLIAPVLLFVSESRAIFRRKEIRLAVDRLQIESRRNGLLRVGVDHRNCHAMIGRD